MTDNNTTRKIALVRNEFTNEIVDALVVEEDKIKDTNLTSKFLEKWPPFTYSYESVIGNDLNSFFVSKDIRTIYSLAELNRQGKNTAKPNAFFVKGNIPKSNETDKIKEYKKYREILSRCEEESLSCFISVSGEANPKIYDESLLRALEQISNNNGNIAIIAGPVVITKEDDHTKKRKTERSIIPELAKLKNTRIYCSNTRQSLHFRVGGDDYLYVEIPHLPAIEERHGWFYDHDQQAIQKFKKIFKTSLKSDSVWFSEKPDEDFLYLTESELNYIGDIIKKEIGRGGKPFNEYTKEDFLRLMDRHKVHVS